MTVRAAAAAVLLLALTVGPTSHGGGLRGDLLITADRLFDGNAVREPGAVLVRGGRIVAVGGTLDATATRTIALGNATIMPGVIDLHVHDPGGDVRELQGGVTTVRDVGAPLVLLHPPARLLGLQVLMAGPLVTVPGGYPTPVWGHTIALDVRSPIEARKAVQMLARRGAAVVKIALEPGDVNWPMLTVP